jgi:hypothetical protein
MPQEAKRLPSEHALGALGIQLATAEGLQHSDQVSDINLSDWQ